MNQERYEECQSGCHGVSADLTGLCSRANLFAAWFGFRPIWYAALEMHPTSKFLEKKKKKNIINRSTQSKF